MNQLQWVRIVLMEWVGWRGLAAVLMLMMAGGHYVTSVYPLGQKLEVIKTAADRSGKSSGAMKARDPGSDLVVFRAFFQGSSLEERLDAIHESVGSTGLVSKRIEYRVLEEKRSRLRQYQIVMPLTGSYPRIRQFISLILAKLPAMSLDHISFQRRNVGDATVDAELRFTLFLVNPT